MSGPADENNFQSANGVVTHLPDGKSMTFREIAWAAMMRPFMLPEGSVPELAGPFVNHATTKRRTEREFPRRMLWQQ